MHAKKLRIVISPSLSNDVAGRESWPVGWCISGLSVCARKNMGGWEMELSPVPLFAT